MDAELETAVDVVLDVKLELEETVGMGLEVLDEVALALVFESRVGMGVMTEAESLLVGALGEKSTVDWVLRCLAYEGARLVTLRAERERT